MFTDIIRVRHETSRGIVLGVQVAPNFLKGAPKCQKLRFFAEISNPVAGNNSVLVTTVPSPAVPSPPLPSLSPSLPFLPLPLPFPFPPPFPIPFPFPFPSPFPSTPLPFPTPPLPSPPPNGASGQKGEGKGNGNGKGKGGRKGKGRGRGGREGKGEGGGRGWEGGRGSLILNYFPPRGLKFRRKSAIFDIWVPLLKNWWLP